MPAPPDTNGPSPDPPPPPFWWWCAVCQRRTPFGYDELARFSSGGWPECCGERVLVCARRAAAGE